MKKMVTLYADSGMVLTDGEHYATTVSLAEGETGEAYREITREEYERLQRQEGKA